MTKMPAAHPKPPEWTHGDNIEGEMTEPVIRTPGSTSERMLWAPLFDLRPDDEASLQVQVRRTFIAAILDGALPRNSKLPSSRQLARCLGIARNTVVLAYRQLADEGWIGARPRSGYVVLHEAASASSATEPTILRAPPGPAPAKDQSGDNASSDGPCWAERLHGGYAVQRNIQKPTGWHQYPFPFVYGQPDPDLFPVSQWRECSRAALAVLSIRDWSADLIDGDDSKLIDQLRRRILPRRGIFAASDQIMITVGTQNALYMLAQLLTDRHSVVGIEDPGYPDARNILATRGAEIRALPLPVASTDGIDRLRGCDLLYLTPSHQCPTSSTMTVSHRKAILDAAIRHDLLIIEDDYESEFSTSETPTPALKSLDRSDRVIYLGSLSKSLAPGLRIGYLVGARELIAEGRALRRLMLRHPPANNQRAAATFISLGHYDMLLHRLAAATSERATILTKALAQHAPELRFEHPHGGSSLWIAGPRSFDSRRFAHLVQQAGVLIEPGDVFFASPPEPCPFFRLGYSSIRTEQIPAGIRRLADLLRATQEGRDHDRA